MSAPTYQPPRTVREVVLRAPVRIVRGQVPCAGAAGCEAWAEDERHTTTVAECDAFRHSEGGCPDPSAHHAYRARPWWRRIRRERSWEGWL